MSSPYLGLDIGLHFTGTAISESGLLARPFELIECKYPHMHQLFKEVVRIIQEEKISTLIVGIPETSEQQPTRQSVIVDKIISQLERVLKENNLNPDLIRYNEFGSTQTGQELYPDLNDNLAAATVILQDYLDYHAQNPSI